VGRSTSRGRSERCSSEDVGGRKIGRTKKEVRRQEAREWRPIYYE